MSAFGFIISRILACGTDVKNAELDFSDDVTVVAGLSNTGKTYVFQSIKYLLGSEKPPKKINESKGYDKIYLELKLPDGSYNTVYRSLLGGNALLYLCRFDDISQYSEDPETLLVDTSATKKNRTLSEYYAELSGFFGKKVRKNADGVTEKMGFPLMRHLSVIDEVDIIKEESPILGGQYIHETKEKSFLKFLLTGEDDSSIVAKVKPNVVSNRKGKLEVIGALLNEYEIELKNYPPSTKEEALQQSEKLESALTQANADLSDLFESVKQVELEVSEHWQGWKEKESRMLTVEELLIRFHLLGRHYDSDMARLEAISEAGDVFSQLKIGRCPVCSSSFSEAHLCDPINIDSIVLASEAEMTKIQQLQKDLNFNIDSLHKEKRALEFDINSIKIRYQEVQDSVNFYQSVEIKGKVSSIELMRGKLRDVNSTIRLLEKIETIRSQQEQLKNEISTSSKDFKFSSLSTSLLTDLSINIKNLLDAWQYEDMKSVSFSEENFDFVINGNDRNLSGKGYRALTYSSFVIALLQYCKSRSKPHCGFVVIDSPLCTLRSRHVDAGDSTENGELIGDEIKDSFYSDLSKLSGKGQIIIFENDGPNSITSNKLKYHRFTKDRTNGRYGFFPVS